LDDALAPKPPYTLRAWDLKGAPTDLKSLPASWQEPSAEFVADGFVYGSSANGDLWRTRLAGGDAEVIDTGVTRTWLTDGAIWWAKSAGTTHQLWRLRRVGSTSAELVTQGAPSPYNLGDDSMVLYRASSDPLGAPNPPSVRESLVDGSKDVLPFSCAGWLYVDKTVAYCDGFFPVYKVCRFSDLESGTYSCAFVTTSSLNHRALPGSNTNWIYFSEISTDRIASAAVWRFHKGTGDKQEVFRLDVNGLGRNASAAVTTTSIVWWWPWARRFVVKPLPALPCSATLACPEGQTCGADSLCYGL
jgi:hypothetical protein